MSDHPPLQIRGLSSEDVWDHENAFYWFSGPDRLGKALAHWELYKTVVDLPGEVFELGVFKGASLVRFATFRQALEAESSRRIVGFDAFGAFPTDRLTLASDAAFVESFEEGSGRGLSRDEVAAVLARKGFGGVELVAGDVFETLPAHLDARPETRVALLHLDMDVHEPTALALELLWERVVPGGLVVVDDYGAVEGATRAVDAFFAGRGVRVEKLRFYKVPAFVRKPG